MSNLGPQQQNASYDGILQIPGGVTAQLQQVQDGEGRGTGLFLSSSGGNVTTSSSFAASINGVTLSNVIPRLISDGFGDYVSVKDFGAIGDGVTDDTAAIQSAINSVPLSTGGASSGRTIYFPSGTYIISNTLVVGYRRIAFFAPTVMGSGSSAIIKQVTDDITWFDFTTGNADVIAFQGIEFLGSGVGIGVALALGSSGQACYDSRITNCWFSAVPTCVSGINLQGCHITNCAFDSGVTYGINIASGSKNLISNNRFYGNSTAGIYFNAAEDNLVTGNIFDFCGYNDTLGFTTGAIISYASGSTLNKANQITGNTFRANQIDILANGNGGVYSANTGVNELSITSNKSDQCVRGFLYLAGCNYSNIIGNSINRPGSSYTPLVLAGTSTGNYLSGNLVSAISFPAYSLSLGASTVSTSLGLNKFVGSNSAVQINSGATVSSDSAINGTWSPSIGGTATYTVQEGYYVKVGRIVFVKGKIIINALGTGSATTISGLPFAADNSVNASQASGSVSYFSGLATSVVSLVPVVTNNASTIVFDGLTAAGTTMSPGIAVFASSTRIDFSVVYSSEV